eukprot:14852_1
MATFIRSRRRDGEYSITLPKNSNFGRMSKNQPLLLLCFDLAKLPGIPLAALLLIGHTSCSVIFSYLHETEFRLENYKFAAVNTALCVTMFLLCGAVEMGIGAAMGRGFKMRAKPWEYAVVGLGSGFLSVLFVNLALLNISYPTRIVLGASKLFFVMLARAIFLGKRYRYFDYLNVLVLIIGITLVTVADRKSSTSKGITPNPLLGFVYMVASVVSDVITVLFNEKVLCKKRKCSSPEIMFFSGIASTLAAWLLAVARGEIFPAYEHAQTYPQGVWYPLVYAPVNYFATVFIVLVIASFGGFQSELVKSIRKVFQIVISFALIPKVFTLMHGIGLGLFGTSLAIGAAIKYFDSQPKKAKRKKSDGEFALDNEISLDVKPKAVSADADGVAGVMKMDIP